MHDLYAISTVGVRALRFGISGLGYLEGHGDLASSFRAPITQINYGILIINYLPSPHDPQTRGPRVWSDSVKSRVSGRLA